MAGAGDHLELAGLGPVRYHDRRRGHAGRKAALQQGPLEFGRRAGHRAARPYWVNLSLDQQLR